MSGSLPNEKGEGDLSTSTITLTQRCRFRDIPFTTRIQLAFNDSAVHLGCVAAGWVGN